MKTKLRTNPYPPQVTHTPCQGLRTPSLLRNNEPQCIAGLGSRAWKFPLQSAAEALGGCPAHTVETRPEAHGANIWEGSAGLEKEG